MKKVSIFPTLVAVSLTLVAMTGFSPEILSQERDFAILKRWLEWNDGTDRLQKHLNSLADRMLESRHQLVDALRSPEDWKARQREIRTTLEHILGPYPPKAPLNARVTGTVNKGHFTVEKVVFQSRPGFWVTGCLFLPVGRTAQAPAVLNLIGHTDIAFRAPGYQQLILNLVHKGFIVFAIDPVGQGERLQYYDAALKRSLVGGSTTEHSYFGRQYFLCGQSSASLFLWDGVRAVDYLLSRPEVDPKRIGVTGISGGGTQTSYLAAIDDRILAAAPTCYICGFRRLLESIGPQDAEQNFLHGLDRGIDHGDFLEARAPNPTLVVATTRDFFSIQGARETVAEARAAYKALGAEDNLILVEDDHDHGYTQRNREAIYDFFQRSLLLPGDAADRELPYLTREELTVTPTGQLLDSLGGETAFSLLQPEVRRLSSQLEASRRNLTSHLRRIPAQSAEISGYLAPDEVPAVVFRGRQKYADYAAEMFLMKGEGTCIVPFLLLKPEAKKRPPVILHLTSQGKPHTAALSDELSWFLKNGFAILAPDLSGTGETGPLSESVAFLSLQIARSIPAIRAAEIVRCLRYARSRTDLDVSGIAAIAHGNMAIPLLHAAVQDGTLARVALIGPLASFDRVARSRFCDVPMEDLVAGALGHYDLPDLEACLAPRPLLLANLKDALRAPASTEIVSRELEVVRQAYAGAGAAQNLTVKTWETFQSLEYLYQEWLDK
ncbi:MAG: acetylxylan esterase [Acidobacteriota bacterium]